MELTRLRVELNGYSSRLGLVHFERVQVQESPPALLNEVSRLTGDYLARGVEMPEEYVKGVRGLLRQGGFKPSGRNRPASEYLLRDLQETGEFKFISNLVDINNLLSLKHFLPMSALDADRFTGDPHLRLGYEKERYVFNPSGQELDLTGLIVIADYYGGASRALGSPIKDSMAGKLTESTRSALAVVYSHPQLTPEHTMEEILAEWCELARKHASGAGFHTRVVTTV